MSKNAISEKKVWSSRFIFHCYNNLKFNDEIQLKLYSSKDNRRTVEFTDISPIKIYENLNWRWCVERKY